MVTDSNKLQDVVLLLQEKYSIFVEMLDLTRRQSILIDDEKNIAKVESLIKRKGQMIQELNQIDARIAETLGIVLKGFNHKKLEDLFGNQLHDSIEKLDDIVLQIYELDQQNMKLMSAKKDEVYANIVKIRNGKKATSNYSAKSIQNGGYFLNRKR